MPPVVGSNSVIPAGPAQKSRDPTIESDNLWCVSGMTQHATIHMKYTQLEQPARAYPREFRDLMILSYVIHVTKGIQPIK